MARKKFKNLKQAERFLKIQIDSAIKEEVAEAVRLVWLQKMQENVYDAYQPKNYQRRMGNKGLADPNNIIITRIAATNKHSQYLMENITTGATNAFGNVEINELIEGREGFAGNPVFGMPARPYTFEAIELLKRTTDIPDALVSALAKRGIRARRR